MKAFHTMFLLALWVSSVGCTFTSCDNRVVDASVSPPSPPTSTNSSDSTPAMTDSRVVVVSGDVSVVELPTDSGVSDSQSDLSMEEMDRRALEDSRTVRTVPVRNDSGVVNQ